MKNPPIFVLQLQIDAFSLWDPSTPPAFFLVPCFEKNRLSKGLL